MHEQFPVATHADVLNDQLEQERQASLFEQNADEILTLFGKTGTLRELLDECPVPAAERSFEANERFTAQALELNGKKISDQFAHLRSEKQPEKSEKTEKPEVAEPKRAETKQAELKKTEASAAEPPKTVRSAPERLLDELEATNEPIAQAEDSVPVIETLVTAREEPREPLVRAQHVEILAEQIERMRELTHEHELVKRETVPLQPVVTKPEVEPMEQTAVVLQPEMNQAMESTVEPTVMMHVETASDSEVQPLEPAATVVEYVAALYEKAVAEVAEETEVNYEVESLDMSELIAEILGIPSEELQTQEPAIMTLPSTPEDSILNTLSIQTKEAEHMPDPVVAFVKPDILAVVPAPLTETYTEQLMSLPAEEAEPLQELVETMALIAERLQFLVADAREASPEAIQIEAVLEEYYDELCDKLSVPVDAEERRQFIATIRIGVVPEAPEAELALAEDDEGTHEFKHGMLAQTHQLPVLLHQTINLARFMISMGLNRQLT